ncbi:MAG: DUF1573 domain-containing protein [Bacteroidota bacterium]
MKNILMTFSLILSFGMMNAQAKFVSETTGMSTSEKLVYVEQKEIDLGDIAHNIPAEAIFVIQNISDETMLITDAKGSCGCTATAYTKTPVAPGAFAEVKATYNAKKIGSFQKSVKVMTNLSEAPISLKIKGNVSGT